MLEKRFGRVSQSDLPPAFTFDITVVSDDRFDPDADLQVRSLNGVWTLGRGDFLAEWDARERRGWIRQTLNPYAIDSVLRVVHSLAARDGKRVPLARLERRSERTRVPVHRASGSGKTTIARLAPADVTLLTDEISYVRRSAEGYRAFGTPFAGELGESGESGSAPIAALFQLALGPRHRASSASTPRTQSGR